jgi:hypothetical protein
LSASSSSRLAIAIGISISSPSSSSSSPSSPLGGALETSIEFGSISASDDDSFVFVSGFGASSDGFSIVITSSGSNSLVSFPVPKISKKTLSKIGTCSIPVTNIARAVQ